MNILPTNSEYGFGTPQPVNISHQPLGRLGDGQVRVAVVFTVHYVYLANCFSRVGVDRKVLTVVPVVETRFRQVPEIIFLFGWWICDNAKGWCE